MKKIFTVSILIIIIIIGLYAGTTGKIAGNVTDARTGEPLPGVNVVVVGTPYGAVTDFDGNYSIVNLEPGTYTVRVSSIGYAPINLSNIKVNIDLTSRQDFKLSEQAVQLENEVVITAERPLVQKDLTSTTAVVGGDDIKQLPVTEIGQVIGLQAGNVAGSIRGGRSGEVAYWIDGVPVTDVFNGGSVVDVNPSMVQELQVLSGAFNAEYGQAMSGIVNIATREGTDKFSGSVTAYGGDFLSNRSGIFKGIQKFEPLNIRNIEASLSGPIIPGDVSFFFNARNIYYGGYLNAIRRYNPNTVAIIQNDQLYILGSDPIKDSIAVYNAMPTNQKADADTLTKYFNQYYSALRANNRNGIGDGKTVSMNWNKKLYLQGKITTRITPMLKLNITGIYDDVESQPYNRYFQYNPDGQGKDFSKGYTTILNLTHTLSNSTFYTFGGSYFEKAYKHHLYENANDPRYVHPSISSSLNTISFATGGNDLNRYYRTTTTGLAKFDLSSQMSYEHFVKVGVEARQHRIFTENITLIPINTQSAYTPVLSSQYIRTQILPDSTTSHDRYVHMPTELSAYIQDKMEFKDLIINIGFRFDYFEPDGNVLSDEEDPSIYSPVKPGNVFFDHNGNGVQDVGEPSKTYNDRIKYWYKKAKPKYQFSPRFGASFPITDRGVIHFSYGHFLQIPNFERLYNNPLFKVGNGTNNVDVGGPMGNADLNPEQTINGEIGIQQQLTDDIGIDVTAYIRDIRNLTGTPFSQIGIGGGGSTASRKYTKYVNTDFGFVKGFIISLDKRFADGLNMSMDYTFQIARGSASDPNEGVSGDGDNREVQLSPLGWDQRHTLNTIISYSAESYGSSLVARYGSGLPYTPRATRDVSVFLTNTATKPVYFNADTRFYKIFPLDELRIMLFLRINNIFDIANEVGVYDDTGRAGLTGDESLARQSGAREYVNTIKDYFTDPTQYSEPRRIEFGVTIDF